MMVKICGITNRDDAVAAVEAGARAVGFNFYAKSPRFVSVEQAAELGEGLEAVKVGIFVDELAEVVESVMRAAKLDVAQVYGGRSYRGLRTWRACRVKSAEFALPPDDDTEAFLLDGFSEGMYGGTGKSFPWSIARTFDKRVVLAGGLDAGNVCDAIGQARPWGVDACSRIESSPGRKDHEKMKRFIEAALACKI